MSKDTNTFTMKTDAQEIRLQAVMFEDAAQREQDPCGSDEEDISWKQLVSDVPEKRAAALGIYPKKLSLILDQKFAFDSIESMAKVLSKMRPEKAAYIQANAIIGTSIPVWIAKTLKKIQAKYSFVKGLYVDMSNFGKRKPKLRRITRHGTVA